ncbi:MAG: hypothetical protein EA357_11985 [Micavibrio sp.]|nr:MAG: hypothetical protein EA357_11985 [Micavibrio sp.]
MAWAVAKIMIAACIISLASWMSGKWPHVAGFVVALPLTTILALLFSYAEYQSPETSITFARNIFLAIPASLLFFVPFLAAGVLHLSFWQCYISGLILLAAGYFGYQYLVGLLS